MAYLSLLCDSPRAFVIQVTITYVSGAIVLPTMNVKRLAHDYQIKVNRKNGG
jgi:hypothetical protein